MKPLWVAGQVPALAVYPKKKKEGVRLDKWLFCYLSSWG